MKEIATPNKLARNDMERCEIATAVSRLRNDKKYDSFYETINFGSCKRVKGKALVV